MRFIKLGIISFVVLFGIVFLISSLIPSHIRISRAVNIPYPKKWVAEVVNDLAGWPQWNELVKNAGSLTYNGWEHKLAGEKLEISLVRTTPDSIITVWRNKHGKEIAGVLNVQQVDSVTVLQYYFDFHQRWYPWEKFASINFDKQWGPAMEQSLENLRKDFENLNDMEKERK